MDPISSESSWVGQVYIDIYFDQFHPIWPFLHRGTFRIAREPCVLIQTVLMIGLWIKGDPDGRDMAMTFHTKLLSAIETQRVRTTVPGTKSLAVMTCNINVLCLACSPNGTDQSPRQAAPKTYPATWQPTRVFFSN